MTKKQIFLELILTSKFFFQIGSGFWKVWEKKNEKFYANKVVESLFAIFSFKFVYFIEKKQFQFFLLF